MRCVFRSRFFLYIGSVDPYHRVSCSAQPISIDVGNLCLTAYSTVTTPHHYKWPRYVEMLQEKLKLHMEIHNCTVFMQDGAPCHKSKVMSEFLSQQRIKVLDWPGNRPDLNPIENLWDILKDKVANKQSTSAKHLQEVIKESWVKDLTREYCSTLVASMPRRLQAVFEAKGGHTKY